jgi:hypothetical protein
MQDPAHHGMKGSYRELTIELAIDFVIMYLVMYTMIATLDHFYFNINNVYMTLPLVPTGEHRTCLCRTAADIDPDAPPGLSAVIRFDPAVPSI